MLKMIRQGHDQVVAWRPGEPLSEDAQWLDLVDPSRAEREVVEALLDKPLPQRDEMSGLGTSNRQHDHGRVLVLHTRIYADEAGEKTSPLGLVVTREQLVTLRYAPCKPLEKALQQLQRTKGDVDGSDALQMLLEAITNDVVERMQNIASDMNDLSHDVFTNEREHTRVLRDKLLRVGKLEGELVRYRTSLLGLGRVAEFVANRPPDWFDQDAVSGAKVVVNDLKTLDAFEDQLTNKLAFLQDAVLGFISTDQNAVMKLFTAASVVTLPPVILAGVWGMNFKHMPELDPPWGYPVALGVMAVSIVLPLIWFGARGWLSRD